MASRSIRSLTPPLAELRELEPDPILDFDDAPVPEHLQALAQVIDFLRVYLSKKLAQRIIMHGVFMDVLGVGVLITGDSGLGKSELGLELISRSTSTSSRPTCFRPAAPRWLSAIRPGCPASPARPSKRPSTTPTAAC